MVNWVASWLLRISTCEESTDLHQRLLHHFDCLLQHLLHHSYHSYLSYYHPSCAFSPPLLLLYFRFCPFWYPLLRVLHAVAARPRAHFSLQQDTRYTCKFINSYDIFYTYSSIHRCIYMYIRIYFLIYSFLLCTCIYSYIFSSLKQDTFCTCIWI